MNLKTILRITSLVPGGEHHCFGVLYGVHLLGSLNQGPCASHTCMILCVKARIQVPGHLLREIVLFGDYLPEILLCAGCEIFMSSGILEGMWV